MAPAMSAVSPGARYLVRPGPAGNISSHTLAYAPPSNRDREQHCEQHRGHQWHQHKERCFDSDRPGGDDVCDQVGRGRLVPTSRATGETPTLRKERAVRLARSGHLNDQQPKADTEPDDLQPRDRLSSDRHSVPVGRASMSTWPTVTPTLCPASCSCRRMAQALIACPWSGLSSTAARCHPSTTALASSVSDGPRHHGLGRNQVQ